MNGNETSHTTRGTLCWRCKNAIGGCSWSKHFQPVDGWVAEMNLLRVGFKYKPVTMESYRVIECPKFEKG